MLGSYAASAKKAEAPAEDNALSCCSRELDKLLTERDPGPNTETSGFLGILVGVLGNKWASDQTLTPFSGYTDGHAKTNESL